MDYNLFKHFPADGDLGGFLLSSFDFAPMNSAEVDNNMQMLFFPVERAPHRFLPGPCLGHHCQLWKLGSGEAGVIIIPIPVTSQEFLLHQFL